MRISESQDARLIGCDLLANTADREGGGVYVEAGSQPSQTNSTFLGDSANLGGGQFHGDADATLVNCTFSGDSANVAGGAICHFSEHHGTMLTLTNCVIWGNEDEVRMGA